MIELLTSTVLSDRIRRGEPLVIAADPAILENLPLGNWIGGSIPSFMGPLNGQVFSKDLALVTSLPSYITDTKIVEYTVDELTTIPDDYFSNGFSLIVLPATSNAHFEFAKNAFSYENIFSGNLVGWISGTDLNLPDQQSVVRNGHSAGTMTDKAVVLHVELPENKFAKIQIANVFEEDPNSDEIQFIANDFEVSECIINGQKMNFSEYLTTYNKDIRSPLIADYSGAKINVSIKKNQSEGKLVSMYAPVFPHVKYRWALPIENYQAAIEQALGDLRSKDSIFSCNCILNYLYAGFEGKKVGPYEPFTLREIAYILLNQTLVYLHIENTPQEQSPPAFL